MKLGGLIWRFAVFSVFLQTALAAQNGRPTLRLDLRTPESVVAASFGKPFEHWKLTASEHSAQVGVPTGLWDVFHLTAHGNRMYVTMVHSGPSSNSTPTPHATFVDSLMLMPNGRWTVSQVLADQPELAELCRLNCSVIRTTDSSGNHALLLKQQTAKSDPMVIYFEGDSAERPEWRSVESIQGIPSWVYVLTAKAFCQHHPALMTKLIGTWHPEKRPQAQNR